MKILRSYRIHCRNRVSGSLGPCLSLPFNKERCLRDNSKAQPGVPARVSERYTCEDLRRRHAKAHEHWWTFSGFPMSLDRTGQHQHRNESLVGGCRLCVETTSVAFRLLNGKPFGCQSECEIRRKLLKRPFEPPWLTITYRVTCSFVRIDSSKSFSGRYSQRDLRRSNRISPGGDSETQEIGFQCCVFARGSVRHQVCDDPDREKKKFFSSKDHTMTK